MARSRSLSMSGLLCRYGREAWAAVRHDLIKMLGESYLHATVLALVDDDRQHVGPHLRAMQDTDQAALVMRSEERRVGNECVSTCRSRWSPHHSKKNK